MNLPGRFYLGGFLNEMDPITSKYYSSISNIIHHYMLGNVVDLSGHMENYKRQAIKSLSVCRILLEVSVLGHSRRMGYSRKKPNGG